MPRLAIVDQTISAGGVERFLHGLVGGMLELPEFKEWDVTIVLNRYNSGGYAVRWPDELTAANVRISYIFDNFPGWMTRPPKRVWGIPGTGFAQAAVPRLLRRYGTPSMRRLAGDYQTWLQRHCEKHKYDVVYFSYPFFTDCPHLPMPVVATTHDFNFNRFKPLAATDQAKFERQTLEWVQRCARIVVSSEFMAGELKHFYPDYGNKVSVVRLGIPGNVKTPTAADLESCRQRLGLPERFLLMVGWIIPHKNQKVAFEAIARLKADEMSIPLVCVGPNSDRLQPGNRQPASPYLREVQVLAEKLGLKYGPDYIGLGYVTDFDIECLYRMASALVMPTLYEAGSFPILEAMRAGCPVICSRIPPLIEQISLLEGNAWMFEPTNAGELADAVQEVLSDAGKTLARTQRAARIVPEVYSWEKTAEGYLAVFQKVLSRTV